MGVGRGGETKKKGSWKKPQLTSHLASLLGEGEGGKEGGGDIGRTEHWEGREQPVDEMKRGGVDWGAGTRRD